MNKLTQLISAFLLFSLSSFALAGEVNINTADAETLAKNIIGVGEKKALAIVAFRDQHGPFKSVDELTQVKGIGLKLVEKNRESLRIKNEN